MTSKFTAANVAAITTRVANAFQQPAHRHAQRRLRRRVVEAARSRPILAAAARRADPKLPERLQRARTIGGCGVWNADADWAKETAFSYDAQRHRAHQPGRPGGMSNIALFEALTRSPRIASARTPRAARGAGPRQAGTRPAWPTARNGSCRPAPRRRCSGRISSRRTPIRPRPRASWCCATACARPTTRGAPRGGTCSRTTTWYADAQGDLNTNFPPAAGALSNTRVYQVHT